MLKSFLISEPQGQKFSEHWDDVLRFQDDRPASPLVIALRALSGNVDLVHTVSGKRRKCRTIYFTANSANSKRASYPAMLAGWMSEDLREDDVVRYLKHSRVKNWKFYDKIAAELCFCLNGLGRGDFIAAFVNLYRLVEWTAFSFPSIYFSSSEDFVGSYNDLKKMMQDNGGGGELAFYKRTLSTLFAGDVLLEMAYDFKIPSNDLEVCRSIKGQIKGVCDGAGLQIQTEPDSNEFSISFLDMPSFIITLRNRYFHYDSSGRQNIDIDKIRDVDLLFATITDTSLRWFAVVFLKVVARSVGFHASVSREPGNQG